MSSSPHQFGSRGRSFSVLVACLLFPCAIWSQTFKSKDLAPAPQFQTNTLQDRVAQLNLVFHDYWEETLKHSPEMASTIGDKRYDDQLSDYSDQAYNDSLSRGERFIERLGAVDTTGMSDQEKLSKRLLVHDLVDQQESSVCEPWQTPVNQFSGIQVDLPMLAGMLTFTSADDYEHYIARLNKVPAAILQISTDLMLGEEAGRSEPQSIMQKVLVQANALATGKPEDSPFASPLQRFPSQHFRARSRPDSHRAANRDSHPGATRIRPFRQVPGRTIYS